MGRPLLPPGRFGRDLLFNAATENHRMGTRWLARHLDGRNRVHVVEITDNHIDASVLPLRPGMLLMHQSVDPDCLPAALRQWDAIRYQEPGQPLKAAGGGVPLLASPSIGMNVLSLDERHVVVQDIQGLWGSKTGHRPLTCWFACGGSSVTGSIADL